MTKLENYIKGNWVQGDGDGQPLYDAVTGQDIASATTKGLDFKGMLEYARNTGNPALRKMSFHERGNMLKALALHLRNHLAKFYSISYMTGATKADSWIDIEGGIGNLFANASLRRKFPDESFCIDGDKAVAWEKSRAPAGYDKKAVSATLKKLVTGAKEIDRMVKAKASDQALKTKLSSLHAIFHEIMEKCENPGHQH